MSQLLYEDCIKIEVYLDEKLSHRQIAIKLHRSNSSISDEIRKYSINWKYIAGIAWIIRQTKRRLINLFRCKIKPWSGLGKLIIDGIQKYWSPEQIAWKYKTICKDTIYRYIKLSRPDLIKKYFRRAWKKYKYWTIKADYIYNRKSIHERPVSENNRSRFGHWEGDTVWRNRKWWFVKFTERKSLFELAGVLRKKTAVNVTIKMKELFDRLPDYLKKTVTLDNGREFVDHFIWKPLCWLDTYFADVGNPWQRWLNENTNWLLRQFFPKKTDLAKITQQELDSYINLLNNRPRKKLWFLSPFEFLLKHHCAVLDSNLQPSSLHW